MVLGQLLAHGGGEEMSYCTIIDSTQMWNVDFRNKVKN